MIKCLLVLLILASCGRVESPEEFFNITGDTGSSGTDGINGTNGNNGTDGSSGNDGTDGTNGTNGVDGQDADVTLVEVCTDTPGNHIETLVKSGGKYLAFLTSNKYKKQRLVLLIENVTYVTTDGRNVSFKIVNEEVVCE